MIFNLYRIGSVFVGRLQLIHRHLGFCARGLRACNNQLRVALAHNFPLFLQLQRILSVSKIFFYPIYLFATLYKL